MYLTQFSTPWGDACIRWTESGINALFLPGINFSREYYAIAKTDPFDAVVQLRYYFEKKLHTFKLPLDCQGTVFQQAVWQGLQQIPYGATWSYRQLAEAIGNPGAVRAVGNANGANPVPLIIPCHRVIRSNGTLGGYSQGIAIKQALLKLENANPYFSNS
ncbi:MAG TPA: methylated-DNA--[protein]-cysteine S-methyltransferase [Bacillota bacterium]|nr:methylated-DNA--[protein]-cysteine S-methyltransferase [Bacillota bacterium]